MSGTTIVNVNGSCLVRVGVPAPPVSASLIGVPQATVQAWLTAAQAALQQLNIGAGMVSVEYAEGAGHRKVIYRTADAGQLMGWISQLQGALGIRTRRAIGVRF